jgi:hypothetical protein
MPRKNGLRGEASTRVERKKCEANYKRPEDWRCDLRSSFPINQSIVSMANEVTHMVPWKNGQRTYFEALSDFTQDRTADEEIGVKTGR